MGKSDRLKHADENRIEFRDSWSLLRTIFGGAMVLFGALFFSATIVGLFRAGGWEAALARPANTLGILAFAAFFFVVGWFAAFYRRHIVIDALAREVAIVRTMFPLKRETKYKLEDFRAVVLVTRKTLSSTNSPSYHVYSVRLIRPDKDWIVLAALTSVTEASALGNKVAKIMGVNTIEMSEAQWEKFA